MFKMDFRKKITAFLVILSLLAVYTPTALFAASAPTVSANSGAITANSAAITVTITDPDATALSGTLYYSTNSDAKTGGGTQSVAGNGSYPISGLTANTTYYYLVEIPYSYVNDVEPFDTVTGTATSGGSFTTNSDFVAPAFSAFSANYSSSAINASASVSDGTGPVTARGFYYSYTNSTPGVGDNYVAATGTTSFSASFTPTVGPTSCYVRACVVSDGAPYYSSATTVNITPAVTNLGDQTIAITAPVTGTSAQASIASGTGYTGVISWYNVTDGTSHSGNFVASKVYRANVTLTSTSGYQWPSTAPAITVPGSQSVSTGTVSGTGTGNTLPFSATFAATTSVNPPVLTTNAASSIAATTATANINISSLGSGFTSAGVVYSKNSGVLTVTSSGALTSNRAATTTGNQSFNLTGLTPGTTYYVRGYVYALPSGPYTYSTNTISFTTVNAVLPSVAATVVNSYDDTSAVINLNVTSDGGAPILERGVVYSTSNSSPTTSNTRKTASGTTGSTTVSLTGLSPETTYYVRSYATNSVGTTYGTYKSFKTTASQSANSPTVTTESSIKNVTSSTADITIDVRDNNGYTVTQYGVVYSRYDDNSNPTVGGSKCYTEYSTGSKTGSVTFTITDLDPDTKYAVKAYARNSKGYGYGTVRTFTTEEDDGTPVVITESTSRISDTEIEVTINLKSHNGSTTTEKGVVYSRTSSSPRINSSSSSSKKASGTSTGTSTVSLTGLTSGSSYYVCAYATNRHGTSYGSVKQVTANDYTVTTNAISDITPSSAIVGGTVSSSINSDVLERGVVYSRSNKSPTVNDTRARSDKTTYGSYSLTITGLDYNETYYVRAYIRTSDGYSYGNMVTFSTNTNLTVTVLYKTEDGLQVGSQNITAAHNSTITQTALNVPSGYALVNSYYSYNVTAAATTTVLVRKTVQNAYMEGSSNYLFEPDKKITRIEVAKMIHSLKGNVYAGEGKTYYDMPTAQAELAALKYVTAMSYMVGDPDGKFRPYDPITRAEVVVICNTVYGLQSNDLTNPFSDIANHWAKNYIIIGYRNKALFGYPDGTFKPQTNMTRAEAVIVFANAEKRDLTPIGTTQFTDVPASHWAYKYIMNAAIPKK